MDCTNSNSEEDSQLCVPTPYRVFTPKTDRLQPTFSSASLPSSLPDSPQTARPSDFVAYVDAKPLVLSPLKVELPADSNRSLLRKAAEVPAKRTKWPESKATCKCRKSRCLKLYCDCLAAGSFCVDCNCVDCFNTEAKAQERTQAVELILQRNPKAFRSKGKLVWQGNSLQPMHQRGCTCTKSRCKKKYCECFLMGAKCSDKCRCVGCKNSHN